MSKWVRHPSGQRNPDAGGAGEAPVNGTHKQLHEITQRIGSDSHANLLLDNLLNACFDHALGDAPSGISPDQDPRTLARLMIALDRFNMLLQSDARLPGDGFYVGSPEQVSAWAQDLTEQIWEDRPE